MSAHAVAFNTADGTDPEAVFPGVPLPDRLRTVSARRRLDFLAGRYCALRALELASLAIGPASLPVGDGGAPAWPAGAVGSITHAEGFASAAVASACDVAGVGIDCEPILASSEVAEVRALLVEPGELEQAVLAGRGEEEALTLIFSAKESLYKCLYPRVGRFFDQLDARVTVEPPSSFVACLKVDLAPGLEAGTRLRGRFAVDGRRVHTAVVIDHGSG
ncbi:MAG TPA: 4'-phosphopantetheinyl transferase superfamily protein [Polyangiaceae bacterium]